MIYAYVKSQTCIGGNAFRPDDEYMGKPVAEHGELEPWRLDEAATIRLANRVGTPKASGAQLYNIRCARAVCDLLGWSYMWKR